MVTKTGNKCGQCSHYAWSPAGLAYHERTEHPIPKKLEEANR